MKPIHTTLRSFKPLFEGRSFVLAVSGGPDSQVLLNSMAHVMGADRCIAVGVNHGLREEADSELDVAEELAAKLSVPFYRERVDVKPGGNLFKRARDLRYGALEKHVKDLKVLCTAHHADDQVETILLQLFRGSSLKSLRGMTQWNEKVFRPLLPYKKEELYNYPHYRKIRYCEDPTNSKPEVSRRVWVRQVLLPQIRVMYPGVDKSLTKFACGLKEQELV